jgi:hypothetical protein
VQLLTAAGEFFLRSFHSGLRFATNPILVSVFCCATCIASACFGQTSENGRTIRTVRNGEEGLWDKQPGKEFMLEKDMVIGVEDGDENYLFGRIFDVAVSSGGAIYVLDNGFNRVQKYDSSGVYIGTFGRKGEGPGEFNFPIAIAVDGLGNVYVADRSKVQIFDVTGTYTDSFEHGFSGSFPRSIRINESNGIYLSCLDIFEQQVLHKYSFNHTKVASFCNSYAIGEKVDVREEQTFGGGAIDINQKGLVYFTQRLPYVIRVFSPNGELLWDVYRESQYVQKPIVKKEERGLTVRLPTSSQSIIVFDDNYFVNVLRNQRDEATETIIDLFDSQGAFLKSHVLGKSINLRCKDAAGRLYSIESGGFPKLVRYRASY